MKALSLWQPWAAAVAVGSKLIETRSWKTAYRGPLAIHAAKHQNKGELFCQLLTSHWSAALASIMRKPIHSLDLDFGCVVAICTLVDVRPMESFTLGEVYRQRYSDGFDEQGQDGWTEGQLGDFSLGRYGWVLEDIKPLRFPVPFRGRQRLFEIPDDVIDKGM